MLNLIYSSFPFGKAEMFAEYEIPVINEIAGNQYRIFTFYRGKDFSYKRTPDISGDVITVRPSAFNYIIAVLSLFSPSAVRETGRIRKRVSHESLLRCVWRMVFYRAYAYAFCKKAKAAGISDDDIFVSYWLNECAYSAAVLKKRKSGIRFFSRAHGFDVFEERNYLPFRNGILETADGVFAVNETERQYILDHYPGSISGEKILVSHLGINLPESFSQTADREPFTIVTCSSIIPLKRLDLMIDALSGIKEFDFRWIHIGGGPLEEQIKELAAEKLSAENQNYEFSGHLPLSQVHGFYREHNVSLFVNCSDTEGIPVSIMEAMSYGIPAAARNVGGNSEIVDGKNGILLDSVCTAQNLADAIRAVQSLSGSEYAEMRRAARETVEKEFNADIQYPAFFNEVMKSAAG